MTQVTVDREDAVKASAPFTIRVMSALTNTQKLTWSRLKELAVEFPRVVFGVSFFWPEYKPQLILVLLINIVIFMVDVVVTYAYSRVVQVYTNAADYSYVELLGVTFLYFMVLRVFHEIVLPFGREWFIARYLKFRFIGHVAKRCVQLGYERGLATLEKDRQPAIIEGSNAVFNLTQMLLREPIVAVRGVIILLSLLGDYPYLVLAAILFMLIDLMIIVHMDAYLWKQQSEAGESEFHAWGSVAAALDEAGAADRTPEEMQVYFQQCEERFKVYETKNARLMISKLKYQELLRNGLEQLFDLITYGTFLYWVRLGEIEFGDLLFYIGLLGRAQGPFHVIYNFQQTLMNMRPALRRLDEMCGIGINLSEPKAVSAA